jgi:hypothetical protein
MIGAAICLLAQTAATLTLTDRSEARIRTDSASPPNGAQSPGVDLETTPEARLAFTAPQWEGLADYSLVLTAPDLEAIGQNSQSNPNAPNTSPTALNIGTFEVGWHDRRVRLQLNESASYGVQNYGYLSGVGAPAPAAGTAMAGATPTGAPVQTRFFNPGDVNIGSSQTTLTIRATLDRRWLLIASAGYAWGGGLDSAQTQQARTGQVIPIETSPSAMVQVDYRASRIDDLRPILTVRRVDAFEAQCGTPANATATTLTLCDPETNEADASMDWRRKWSRTVTGELGAGAALVNGQTNSTAPYYRYTHTFPTGLAILTERLEPNGQPDSLIEEVRLGPTVDLVSGLITQTLAGLATAVILDGRRTYLFDVGFSQTLPLTDPGAFTAFEGRIEVRQRLGLRFDVGVGERLVWQFQSANGGPATYETLTVSYVDLIYHEPPHVL